MQIKSWLSSRTNWTLLLKNHKDWSLGLVISFRSTVQLLYNVWPNVLHIYLLSFSTVFHQKKSRKFRICSFRIHHRTPKLLCLHYSCLRKFEGWCWLWFKPFRSCTYLSLLFVLFTRSYIQLRNYKSDLSFETNLKMDSSWYQNI